MQMDALQLNTYFAGDIVEKTVKLNGYSPLEWTLFYEIGALQFTFSDDGENFILSAPLTGVAVGETPYRVGVINIATPTTVKTLITGRLKVIDLTYQSHARKVLDAIQATLEGKASSAQSEMTINGRSIKYFSPEQLLAFRATYKREVANEEAQDRIRSGLGSNKKILVRL